MQAILPGRVAAHTGSQQLLTEQPYMYIQYIDTCMYVCMYEHMQRNMSSWTIYQFTKQGPLRAVGLLAKARLKASPDAYCIPS